MNLPQTEFPAQVTTWTRTLQMTNAFRVINVLGCKYLYSVYTRRDLKIKLRCEFCQEKSSWMARSCGSLPAKRKHGSRDVKGKSTYGGDLREELSASVKRVIANRDIRGRLESSLPPNDRFLPYQLPSITSHGFLAKTQITFKGRSKRRLSTLFSGSNSWNSKQNKFFQPEAIKQLPTQFRAARNKWMAKRGRVRGFWLKF